MYQIIDGRGTGKTSRLLLLAKETGATVVCGDPTALRHKAYAYGLTGINFITYKDFICAEESPAEGYLIDEIDDLLNRWSVIGYTMSKDE